MPCTVYVRCGVSLLPLTRVCRTTPTCTACCTFSARFEEMLYLFCAFRRKVVPFLRVSKKLCLISVSSGSSPRTAKDFGFLSKVTKETLNTLRYYCGGIDITKCDDYTWKQLWFSCLSSKLKNATLTALLWKHRSMYNDDCASRAIDERCVFPTGSALVLNVCW